MITITLSCQKWPGENILQGDMTPTMIALYLTVIQGDTALPTRAVGR